MVAMGGGGFLMEPDNPLLDNFALGLTGKARPRVCLLPTASGDADRVIDAFYAAFPKERAEATHLSLFRRQRGDLRARLLENDLIYIGGGNTANMLVVWRLHGMDEMLREASSLGIVLAGVSAGACCLFESCITDSFGPSLAGLDDGLGFLPGSFCPHYDGEKKRRPRYRQQVAEGLAGGLAADDGAALHFVDGAFREAVSSRRNALAYSVAQRTEGHKVEEMRLSVRYLGPPQPSDT
jgi:dipeptidase E